MAVLENLYIVYDKNPCDYRNRTIVLPIKTVVNEASNAQWLQVQKIDASDARRPLEDDDDATVAANKDIDHQNHSCSSWYQKVWLPLLRTCPNQSTNDFSAFSSGDEEDGTPELSGSPTPESDLNAAMKKSSLSPTGTPKRPTQLTTNYETDINSYRRLLVKYLTEQRDRDTASPSDSLHHLQPIYNVQLGYIHHALMQYDVALECYGKGDLIDQR